MRHPLYLLEQGTRLKREGRRLLVVRDEEVLARVSVLQVSQVIVFGNVDITTPALKLLLDEGIEVVLLSQRGRFYGRLVGAESGHGKLRVAQVLRSRDASFALEVARRIVQAKIQHMRRLLQRHGYRRPAIQPNVHEALQALGQAHDQAARCRTLNSLLGVEGSATGRYFRTFRLLLHAEWPFEGRRRRPPTDPVNVLLSFGYTILQQNVLGAVLTAGLDPYVGFLHQMAYNRPSLALDLMEPFRPLIVDSVVLRCINNEIVRLVDFTTNDDPTRPIMLGDEGKRRYIRELEYRLTQPFKHPATGEQVTYRRLFLLEAYALARVLTDEDANAMFQPFRV